MQIYLLKIFGKLPETISMSEPFAFFNVHQLYCQGKIPKEKYLKLLKSCVKLQYKPTIQRGTQRYLLFSFGNYSKNSLSAQNDSKNFPYLVK